MEYIADFLYYFLFFLLLYISRNARKSSYSQIVSVLLSILQINCIFFEFLTLGSILSVVVLRSDAEGCAIFAYIFFPPSKIAFFSDLGVRDSYLFF